MPWLAVARARTPSVAATTWAETTSHTLARTRISGAVCRSRSARARVARSVTRPPYGPRRRSAAVPQRPERGLARLPGEPVEEDLAVEVVDLVLQRAGQEAGALESQRLAVHVEPLHDGVHRPPRGRPDAGDGQAALVAVLGLLGQLDDPRVDQVPDASVDIVGEGAQPDADLRCGDAGPARVGDGVLQVAHERRQLLVEAAHLVGGGAEDRVTELADGTDRHGASLPTHPVCQPATPGRARASAQPDATESRHRSGSSPAATNTATASSGACCSRASAGSTAVTTSMASPCPAAQYRVATASGSAVPAKRPACRARSAASTSSAKVLSATAGSSRSAAASNIARYRKGSLRALWRYAAPSAARSRTGSPLRGTAASRSASRAKPSWRTARHRPGMPPKCVYSAVVEVPTRSASDRALTGSRRASSSAAVYTRARRTAGSAARGMLHIVPRRCYITLSHNP